MAGTVETIVTILALDLAFAMATGMTGIHGLIVDAGANLGQQMGITPLFGAEAAAHVGHAHAAAAPIAESVTAGTCEMIEGAMQCA
jgi:hypothetical protein